MTITRGDYLHLLLRFHKFIDTRRRGSREELARQLGVQIKMMDSLRRRLCEQGASIRYNRNGRYYEYTEPFEVYVGRKRLAS